MEYLTILGSCRQQPIKSIFTSSHNDCSEECVIINTSQIQDELNYPHYTKEILQQIRYLKYQNIPEEYTKYCFRSGLLFHNTIDDNKYNILKNQFDNTTFFLIEIASRISYKWNELYLHHIEEEDQYGFYDRNNILKYDLTDEEIEEDIIQIKNELYPKPFIIISHFATYNSGKRYELILLLENICNKLHIPFLNQTDIINKYGIHIIQNERTLSHYTEEGKKYVGETLFNKINEVKMQHVKQKLYQVYYTSEERVKKHAFHGFGDYIRGTIHLYQLYKNYVDLKINFSNHLLSELFLCDNHLSIKECEETKYIFATGENFLDYTQVFTNNFNIYEIDNECREFIIKQCLTPRIHFEKKILSLKNTLHIENYNYSIIHIRLEDNNEVMNENILTHILNIIDSIYSNNQFEKLLLISSNEVYSNYINLPFIIKTTLKPAHIGLNTITMEECENTMLEFMLMTTCNKIHQLSVYEWGSGFSDTIHKIYNVPIEKYNINIH